MVDEEVIAEVLANWTGIPVYKLTEEETSKLLRMEEELHKRIIGQNNALKAVSQAIRRTRAGLKDPKRPSGSFIFLGPSGVGKTETAKALAEFLFGDENSLVQLDMSEYMEKHTVSRLVGSPPGYVGYEEGGQLTEAVRRQAVLGRTFRRDRKGAPGRLQRPAPDPRGWAAYRRPGPHGGLQEHRHHHDLQPRHGRLAQSFGRFRQGRRGGDARADDSKVNDALKQHFRPEFLNRIDEVIVFHELTKDEVTEIIDLMIRRVREQLESQGISVELTRAAKYLVVERGYDAMMGARPLRRAFSGWSKIRYRRRSSGRSSAPATPIIVDVENGEITFKAMEQFEPPPVELAGAGSSSAATEAVVGHRASVCPSCTRS